MIRADGGGGTHEYLAWLTRQRLSYSVGFTLTQDSADKISLLPEAAWTPAYDFRRHPTRGCLGRGVDRDAGVGDLAGGNAGDHPGRTAAPRCAVAVHRHRREPVDRVRHTNSARGQFADLELRHRRRARCQDRIRGAKDTGMRNLPLHEENQNRIWIAVVQLATEMTAWMGRCWP